MVAMGHLFLEEVSVLQFLYDSIPILVVVALDHDLVVLVVVALLEPINRVMVAVALGQVAQEVVLLL